MKTKLQAISYLFLFSMVLSAVFTGISGLSSNEGFSATAFLNVMIDGIVFLFTLGCLVYVVAIVAFRFLHRSLAFGIIAGLLIVLFELMDIGLILSKNTSAADWLRRLVVAVIVVLALVIAKPRSGLEECTAQKT